jgi:hypothetical protein
MHEVPVAHFTLRWEADYARGFLEDSGIPCRLQDAALGAGGFYTGDLHGASVLVHETDLGRAREALESAGVLRAEGSVDTSPLPLLERDLPLMVRSDVTDIQAELEAAKRSVNRHGLYAVLGVTPAALIPLFGLVLQGNGGLVAVLSAMVVARETRRLIRASREVTRLKVLLMEMGDEADDAEAG